MKTWKRGRTAYDAGRRVTTIEQEVFIQEPGQDQPESFMHRFELQLWEKPEMETMLREAGYAILHEYIDYSMASWAPNSNRWVIEANKV